MRDTGDHKLLVYIGWESIFNFWANEIILFVLQTILAYLVGELDRFAKLCKLVRVAPHEGWWLNGDGCKQVCLSCYLACV